MNTNEIMQIALDLVDMKDLPADSTTYIFGENVTKLLYGIDIGIPELLYAKNNGYDCVIAHHPIGLVNPWNVFCRHLDQLISKGIPEELGKKIIKKKLLEFKFGFHARNYDAVPSFARLINMPFLNIHCPSDELGRRLVNFSIQQLLKKKGEATLNEVKDHLKSSFKEFQNAKTDIEIAKGNGDNLLGNWIFSHGAFTNGGYAIANCYYQYGVNTVIYIHIAPPELLKILKVKNGQLLITGHIASDSIGINPFLDKLEEKGIQVTFIGGLIRS